MTVLQIIRIPILPFGMVNSHLILGAGGCILVDAGLPGSESKIEKVLTKHRLTFRDITQKSVTCATHCRLHHRAPKLGMCRLNWRLLSKLIVVTHAHVDHAGSAALLRKLSGAPIAAHADDAKHFSGDTPMTFCPTGWFGRLFLKTPLMFESYNGFEPDILLSNDNTLDLSRYGIPGTVTQQSPIKTTHSKFRRSMMETAVCRTSYRLLSKHTPGHTAGSISIELSTKDALVGDLIVSGILIGGLVRTNHAIRPPFEDDPRTVGLALQRLLDSGMERFYMGHGGPLNAREVQRHALTLMAME